MDYSQPQTSHYAVPPTLYATSTSSPAIIGPISNPNPSFDQVPIPITEGIDASLTSPIGYAVSQYQPATYASYQASMPDATGPVGLAAAYLSSMPTVGPVRRGKKKKASNAVTARDLEAKKQKLIESGVDVNSIHTCTICNVVCNNDKVFALHSASEKHISRVNGKPCKGLAERFVSQQAVYSANISAPYKKIKAKKTIALGAVQTPTVAQSVYCDICKITCNTQEMYNNHVLGKKHSKNIKNLTAGDRPIEFVPARSNSAKTDKRSIYCDICKITCNTLEMYNFHVSGKKHNKKIKSLTVGDRLVQSVLAASTSPGTQMPATNDNDQEHQTPTTNDNDQEHVPSSSQMKLIQKTKSKSMSKEDLEAKKRKVVESGAKGNVVKVCDLCNVVCNGPTVFEYHCNGQKHRNMVKKQEENLGGSAEGHYDVAPIVISAEMAAAPS